MSSVSVADTLYFLFVEVLVKYFVHISDLLMTVADEDNFYVSDAGE